MKNELIKDCQSLFYKMWFWIYTETENREKCISKENYFYENNIIEKPYSLCYACEEATRLLIKSKHKYSLGECICSYCPLDNIICRGLNSYYDKWVKAITHDDWKMAAKYAKKISEAAWKIEDDE